MPLARPSRLSQALPLALLLLTAVAASAQEPAGTPAPQGGASSPPPSQGGNPTSSIPDPGTMFGGAGPGAFFGLGIGSDNGDWYLKTIINTDFSIGPVGLGLALPLSLLVNNNEDVGCDNKPCSRDSKTYWSVIRRRDWDNPSDWLRFIRYVRYGHKRETFYALVGQHWSSSIGHGTLVNRYNNTLNLDLNKVGVALDVNTTFFGAETLVDNVFDPNLLAARAYLRPFGDVPFLRGWAVGSTIAVDLNAPRGLLCKNSTSGLVGPCLTASPQPLVVNSEGNPGIDYSQLQLTFGVDTEYELLNNSLIRLVPYIDGNRIAGAGNGLHLGVMTTIRLPIPLLEVSLEARLEYRIMQAGYIPEYFDQTYDLGRVQYARVFSGAAICGTAASCVRYSPKAKAAREQKADPSTGNQGYYGELSVNLAGFVQIGGTLQDYQSDSGASLGLYATVPKLEIIKVQGYYLRKNFEGLANAFALDERSLLGGSLAYKVFGPLYVRGQFQRAWVLNPGSQKIEASDSVSFGVAMFLPFGGGSAGPPEQ